MGGIRELFSRARGLRLRPAAYVVGRNFTDVIIHYGAMSLEIIVVYGNYNHAMRRLEGFFKNDYMP